MDRKEPYVCTQDAPWTPDKGKPCQHPDAKYVSGKDYGLGEYCACYECPWCGLYFEVELPQ